MESGVKSDRIASWLLSGDPSIRWQVLRDLLDAPEEEWQSNQNLVAEQGWGARLLAYQVETGRWTSKLYGKKWISTTYSLLLLKRLGLPRNDERARRACRLFLDEGQWHDGGITPSSSFGRSETCITGFALSLLAWFRLDDPR